jgi:hypothetical protein
VEDTIAHHSGVYLVEHAASMLPKISGKINK